MDPSGSGESPKTEVENEKKDVRFSLNPETNTLDLLDLTQNSQPNPPSEQPNENSTAAQNLNLLDFTPENRTGEPQNKKNNAGDQSNRSATSKSSGYSGRARPRPPAGMTIKPSPKNRSASNSPARKVSTDHNRLAAFSGKSSENLGQNEPKRAEGRQAIPENQIVDAEHSAGHPTCALYESGLSFLAFLPILFCFVLVWFRLWKVARLKQYRKTNTVSLFSPEQTVHWLPEAFAGLFFYV